MLIDESFLQLRKQKNHTLMLFGAAVFILFIGAMLMFNFSSIQELLTPVTVEYSDIEINFLSIPLNDSFSGWGITHSDIGSMEAILPVFGPHAELIFSARGTYCVRDRENIFVNGQHITYDPLTERLEVIEGNVVRTELTPEEQEHVKTYYGWPVISVYVSGKKQKEVPVITTDHSSYQVPLNLSEYVGEPVAIRLAFENHCSTYDLGTDTVRRIDFDTISITQKRAFCKNSFE